ncbi:PEP-CTERM sorting domain-containing protein [Desulfogranum japonicum]|uniref:PEP-CTERM sorting domain-containing protein n=1 Tax=Desulfogranum japonicum TaxID=231447 RepID=UPI00040C0C0C|nr:PEP-CTERM sorting domain-containing protein [Desulfogranum japonicum]
MKKILSTVFFAVMIGVFDTASADVILYDQDFENPNGFVNNGHDVNIYNTVNSLYGNQPVGFSFAQAYTVETLLVTGSEAFGTGYSDPAGTAGNYSLGMLGSRQNDLLGLSFNVGDYDYFNVSIDISSIDLSSYGGTFISDGEVPTFKFTLYDNPTGTVNTGYGTILDSFELQGTASAQSVFDWLTGEFSLNTAGNTNGSVTLQIDLLVGSYAALDNLLIVASNNQVGSTPAPVPEPTTMVLFGCGIAGLAAVHRRRK